MSFKKDKAYKHSLIRDLLYTAIFCTIIAVFLRMIKVADTLTMSLVMSYCIGISSCICIHMLLSVFRPQTGSLGWITVVLGILAGVFIGVQTGSFILTQFLSVPFSTFEGGFIRAMVIGVAFGAVISCFFVSRERIAAAKALMQEEKIKRLSSEKDVIEMNLRLLQAQIEPHFLFNTLSNIHSLMDTDPGTAKTMLIDFMQYLRTSLQRTRNHMTTLGQEMETLEAYLRLFSVRMGRRLNYTIDIPEDLKSHTFPPMLLQPLVENALKHGLEPEIEGGEILIRGRGQDGVLQLLVEDTGRGFAVESGSEVGLQNVKDRLRLLYGEKGRLRLEENRPRGVRAVIEVPL